MSGSARCIVVLVGTDHHDLSRIVRWADDWQRTHPEDDVLVQHGSSPAPRSARGTELVPPTELVAVLTGADVVVTHGGPGTLMAARHAGHHPLAVPRVPALGEHVDYHQVRFVTWASARGLCTGVTSVDELTRTVTALPVTGTRTADRVELGPVADLRRLEESVAERRRRRGPAPSGVAVVYCAGGAWPGTVPADLGGRPAAVVGRVGELWDVPEDAAGCSCGSPRRDCPFWTGVVIRAFGGWDEAPLPRLRSLSAELRARPLAPARRHPGGADRRRYLELALGYRAVCRAALEATAASVVVDSGGPLSDVLPLTHCRELDVRVVRAATTGRADLAVLAALRYRGAQLVEPPQLVPAAGPAGVAENGHQLLPAAPAGLPGSIAR